jgi:hypothetical protein
MNTESFLRSENSRRYFARIIRIFNFKISFRHLKSLGHESFLRAKNSRMKSFKKRTFLLPIQLNCFESLDFCPLENHKKKRKEIRLIGNLIGH